MLTTSALLIGLVTPQVVGEDGLRWGALVFLLFDACALLAAVLAVFPSSARQAGRPDPLYFAHAAQMPKDEHVTAMLQIAADRHQVCAAIASNLHDSCCYMHRGKFRYLRWSSTLFLVGAIGGLVIEAVRLIVV